VGQAFVMAVGLRLVGHKEGDIEVFLFSAVFIVRNKIINEKMCFLPGKKCFDLPAWLVTESISESSILTSSSRWACF